MYIPLIPTGRYHFLENRKMIQIDCLSTKKGGDISYHCWKFKKLDWAEAQYQMGFSTIAVLEFGATRTKHSNGTAGLQNKAIPMLLKN